MRIGIFVDDEDDRKRTVSSMKKQFKNAKFVESVVPNPMFRGDHFDLAIIDYGGLTTIPGNSLGEVYASYINKYAEDHPNTLILYVTIMGANYLEVEGLNINELHNIKWCDISDIGKEWKEWQETGS